MAKKKESKPKKPYHLYDKYEIKGDTLIRKNKFSPKAGDGFYLAEHKDRRVCGKSGYVESKSS